MDEKKVKVIKDWLVLKFILELWFFLGLVNYQDKFICGYLKKVVFLMDLLKKGEKQDWIGGVFDELK